MNRMYLLSSTSHRALAVQGVPLQAPEETVSDLRAPVLKGQSK